MDANAVTSFISSVGFPIACCIAMFWNMVKSEERHKAEIDKLSEAVNNNTIIMEKLFMKLGGEN